MAAIMRIVLWVQQAILVGSQLVSQDASPSASPGAWPSSPSSGSPASPSTWPSPSAAGRWPAPSPSSWPTHPVASAQRAVITSCSASSESRGPCHHAYDGDTSTRWAVDQEKEVALEQHVEFYFDQEEIINRVTLRNMKKTFPGGEFRRVRLTFSDESSVELDWDVLQTGDSNHQFDEVNTSSVRLDFLRLYPGGGPFAGLSEVSFFYSEIQLHRPLMLGPLMSELVRIGFLAWLGWQLWKRCGAAEQRALRIQQEQHQENQLRLFCQQQPSQTEVQLQPPGGFPLLPPMHQMPMSQMQQPQQMQQGIDLTQPGLIQQQGFQTEFQLQPPGGVPLLAPMQQPETDEARWAAVAGRPAGFQ